MTTNRDWIQRTIEHRGGGPVPYNFLLCPPAQQLAREHYGADLENALGLPIRMTGANTTKPLYGSPDEFGPTATDPFGVVWTTNYIDRGAPIGPCLPDPDLSRYAFPNPADAYRFTHIAEWCGRQDGNYRIIWAGDLWERATFMRGMEQILEDLVLHPTFVHDLLNALTAYIIDTIRILVRTGDFECIAVSDDYGTQHGLLMSPAHWREFVKPCLARIYAFAKTHGRAVFHHSCGHVTPIVPDLIDIGLDILHPIQPETMDIARLKHEYGRYLTFCGGVPTQGLLVTGTPDEVRAEVRRLKQEMGRGGGYILEPGITIQADVPAANLFALIDEARRA